MARSLQDACSSSTASTRITEPRSDAIPPTILSSSWVTGSSTSVTAKRCTLRVHMHDFGLAHVVFGWARHVDFHDRVGWQLHRAAAQKATQTNVFRCRGRFKLFLLTVRAAQLQWNMQPHAHLS